MLQINVAMSISAPLHEVAVTRAASEVWRRLSDASDSATIKSTFHRTSYALEQRAQQGFPLSQYRRLPPHKRSSRSEGKLQDAVSHLRNLPRAQSRLVHCFRNAHIRPLIVDILTTTPFFVCVEIDAWGVIRHSSLPTSLLDMPDAGAKSRAIKSTNSCLLSPVWALSSATKSSGSQDGTRQAF